MRFSASKTPAIVSTVLVVKLHIWSTERSAASPGPTGRGTESTWNPMNMSSCVLS